MRLRRLAPLALLLLATATAPGAQINVEPGLDVSLSELKDMIAHGRTGAFPNGMNGASFLTTACNVGTVEVDWRAPMNIDHPFISFLFARELDGRMEQISDRSYVKHGFFAANANQCGPCSQPLGPVGQKLGLGCSDTYATNTNGDRFYLGPPSEIDPFEGRWTRQCSHFDRGEPAVAAPNDCDGRRSLTETQVGALDPVTHRMEIADDDLLPAGAAFYAQSHYVVPGEAEALRADNTGWRRMVPSWNGSQWTFTQLGPLRLGSVLETWSGAMVRSATNGADDGRVFVAVRVTQPTPGTFHYEYAIHNRDASRGVGAIQLPKCNRARIRNLGFSDVDGDPGNDWSASIASQRLRYATGSNPLEWNTIYNLWFDSDAEPVSADLTLEAFAAGPGAPTYTVRSLAPAGLFTVYLSSGCAKGRVPQLVASGEPARASLGNGNFGLTSGGHRPGEVSLLVLGAGASAETAEAAAACTLGVGPVRALLSSAVADADGLARHALPIPADAGLEGLELDVQSVTGPLGADTTPAYSNALRIRVGSSIVDCP